MQTNIHTQKLFKNTKILLNKRLDTKSLCVRVCVCVCLCVHSHMSRHENLSSIQKSNSHPIDVLNTVVHETMPYSSHRLSSYSRYSEMPYQCTSGEGEYLVCVLRHWSLEFRKCLGAWDMHVSIEGREERESLSLHPGFPLHLPVLNTSFLDTRLSFRHPRC